MTKLTVTAELGGSTSFILIVILVETGSALNPETSNEFVPMVQVIPVKAILASSFFFN